MYGHDGPCAEPCAPLFRLIFPFNPLPTPSKRTPTHTRHPPMPPDLEPRSYHMDKMEVCLGGQRPDYVFNLEEYEKRMLQYDAEVGGGRRGRVGPCVVRSGPADRACMRGWLGWVGLGWRVGQVGCVGWCTAST